MPVFKLFVSSPGDVMVERRRVENIVSRLNGEFARAATLETIRWETEFYQAYATFQTQIPPATACDLVIGILKWRLGTELPPDFEHKLPGGRPFPSGTAFEILSAIERRRQGGPLPDIYVFRFTGASPSVQVEDPNRARVEQEWDALKGFIHEWFVTERGHFKAAFNPYTSEDDFETQLEKLLRKWVADKVAGGRVVRWPVEVKGSPFRGLAAFGAKHSPVFFGRSHDTGRAAEVWIEAARRGSPYLQVMGASGSGKSSIARAGLLPRLTTPGVAAQVDVWRIAVMRPGDSAEGPFAALAASLMQNVGDLPKDEEGRGPALPEIALGDSATAADLAAVLSHADAASVRPILNALARVAADERERERFTRPVRCDLVLLIDQFEELFASSIGKDARVAFIKLIAALTGTGRVWVATTLRADFYQKMLEEPQLKALKDSGASYDLAPPGTVELAEIVRAPADAAGLVYERDAATGEGLDSRILRDAERPDMLPLVQLVLSRLFDARESVGGDIVLRLDAYARLGGLKGIVDEAGEKALAGLGQDEATRLPRLLRQLAVPAHDTDGAGTGALTIRGVPLAQAAPDEASRKLVDALVDARLLTTGGSGAEAQVRLAHQRVLEDWARARSIVLESADFYRIRNDVEESVRRWNSGKRRGELLLARGLPLAEAESLVAKYGDELTQDIKDYVRASRNRAKRAQMIGWAVAAVFALLAVGAGVAAKIAVDLRAKAESNLVQAQRAQSEFLAGAAQDSTGNADPVTAALLAIEALPDARAGVKRPYVPEADVALFGAYQALREITVIGPQASFVRSAEFSPDGQRILAAFADKTARIIDVASGRTLVVLDARNAGSVNSAAFDGDGKRVVTASDDMTARIWDATTANTLGILRGHSDAVNGAEFSPDGTRVVTASQDKTARIFDAATGAVIKVLEGHTGAVNRAAFNADGTRVVTASDDKTARLWDAATGQAVATLAGHKATVLDATFSSDGTRVVTASGDRTARIFDAASGEMRAVLGGHQDVVMSAAFNRDGARVVTASADGIARIFDAGTGATLASLAGHSAPVWSAAFSQDGRRVVTGARDGTIRVWTADPGDKTIRLVGHTEAVTSAAFDREGARVVTAANDRTAIIWSARSGERIATLRGHEDDVNSAAFSPDDTRVVTAADDDTARIWDAQSGQQLVVLKGHASAVNSAAFSPDGTRVVTASEDLTARVWEAATGQEIVKLQGHEDDVHGAAFSLDGTRVVTASEDTKARVFDVATGKIVATLAGHSNTVLSAAFSPDGKEVVTGSLDTTARIWNAESGQPIAVLRGHTDKIHSAAFSPGGSRVITASDDKTARIWDAASGSTTTVLQGHLGGLNSAAFSTDGRRVVTASADKTARIWDVFPTSQELLDAAKTAVPRCLTADQRRMFVLPAAPPAWCIETAKWPYADDAWRAWLTQSKAGQTMPLPDTAAPPAAALTAGRDYCFGTVFGLATVVNQSTSSGLLAVRAEPSRNGSQLGQLFNDDVIKIFSRSGSWFRVITPQAVLGWVNSRYVSTPCAL